MGAFYNIAQPALWKATRNLIRDFRELENMQLGNGNAIDKFASMSQQRTKDLMTREMLLPQAKSIIFAGDPIPTEEGFWTFVLPIEGMNNFKKSIPCFGTLVLYVRISEGRLYPIASCISLPAMGFGIYAELGQGAWAEKYDQSLESVRSARLRVTGNKDISKAVVNYPLALFDNRFTNSREFGSYLYDLSLFALGKIDGILIPSNHFFLNLALDCFGVESGAFCTLNKKGDKIGVSPLLSSYYKQ